MAKEWIPETEASQMVDRAPRVLRRLVKNGTWLVDYRTLNGRSFHYLKSDLEKLFNHPERTQRPVQYKTKNIQAQA